MRCARRPPHPQAQQHSATLPIRNPPTTITTLHYTALTNQDTTDQRRHERTGYANHIRQQSDGTHANQADQRAAKTTAHQPHRSCSRNLTINRPHASLPTLNQPGVHGSKRERRQTGWPHHGAPHPPTTVPTDTTEHRNSTSTQPADQHKHTTVRCNTTNQDATNRRRRKPTGCTNNI